MAIDTSVFGADLAGVIADLPAILAWNGTSGISCALSELDQGQTLIIAGNLDQIHYEAVFAFSAIGGNWLSYPAPTDRVSIQSFGASSAINYEVVTAKLSPDAVAVHLILKADHRGGTFSKG